MPNRRLCDLFVLLASALLEAAQRLLPDPALRNRRGPRVRRTGALALAWLGAFATTAAAAASARADAPPARARKQTLEIDCPARAAASRPGRPPDDPGRSPPAGPAQSPDAGRSGSKPPVVVPPSEVPRPAVVTPASQAAGLSVVSPAPQAARPSGVVPASQAVRAPAVRKATVQALRASFYRGDPRALDVLPPATTHRSGDVETSTWDFAEDATMPVWIACVYDDDEVLAAQALPPGTRTCTARLRITPMGDPAGLLAVNCR